jgi:hypothetical protein
VQVVDGPGLEDKGVAQNLATGMDISFGGVDAFLLVNKYGNRVVDEDEMSLATSKQIFGVGVFKHLIGVMTCGDMFDVGMAEQDTPGKGFHEWCKEHGRTGHTGETF